MPQAKISWQWMFPLAIGAILTGPAQANQLKPLTEQGVVPFRSLSNLIRINQNASLGLIVYSGTVVDKQSGNPLQGVKIRKKGNDIVVALSDSLGRFKLELPEAVSVIPYTFEHNGYAIAEMHLKSDMEVKLTKMQSIVLGGISVISLNKEPLYVVYVGDKSCTVDAAKFREISPDWIDKVDILKDAKATALYGSKAANGVIMIGIKKAYAKKIDFSKK